MPKPYPRYVIVLESLIVVFAVVYLFPLFWGANGASAPATVGNAVTPGAKTLFSLSSRFPRRVMANQDVCHNLLGHVRLSWLGQKRMR